MQHEFRDIQFPANGSIIINQSKMNKKIRDCLYRQLPAKNQ